MASRMIREVIPNGIVVLSLGLAIGFTSLLVGIDNAVRHAPVAYADPAHLYELHLRGIGRSSSVDIRALIRALESHGPFTAITTESWNAAPVVTLGTEQRELAAASVSPNYFDVVGVRPTHGRLFDRQADGRSERGVVISERLRRAYFAGDSTLAHSWLDVNGERRRVIGAVPRLVPSVVEADFWEVVRSDSSSAVSSSVLYARLRPGTLPTSAERAATTILSEFAPRLRPSRTSAEPLSVAIYPVRRERLGIPNLQLILFGIGACLLLIASANVVAVLVARAVTRRSELAVRAALGASRMALMRGTFTECALLIGTGALVGWFVCLVLASTVASRITPALRLDDVALIDWNSFATTLGMGAVITIVGAAIPALRASRTDPIEALKQDSTTTLPGRRRLFGWLVGLEIAFALSLVTVTGAFGSLLLNTTSSRSAIDARNVYETRLNLYRGVGRAALSDSAEAAAEAQTKRSNAALLSSIERLPGVASAGAAADVAIAGKSITLEGGATSQLSHYSAVTPGYLPSLGREFLTAGASADAMRSESGGQPSDAVVDDVLAAHLGATRSVVGRVLRIGDGASAERVIVRGVVKHFDLGSGFAPGDGAGRLFVFTNDVPPQSTIVIRLTDASDAMTRSLAAAMHATSPMTAFSSPQSVEAITRSLVDTQRLILTIVGVVSAVALALAVFGIHGLSSYAAVQRRKEVALRAVLGARGRDVLGLLTRESARVAAIGSFAGLALSYGATRVTASLIPAASLTEPLIILPLVAGAIAIVVGGTAVAVRRALAENPVSVLREY